jgi:hypothetical protein
MNCGSGTFSSALDNSVALSTVPLARRCSTVKGILDSFAAALSDLFPSTIAKAAAILSAFSGRPQLVLVLAGRFLTLSSCLRSSGSDPASDLKPNKREENELETTGMETTKAAGCGDLDALDKGRER